MNPVKFKYSLEKFQALMQYLSDSVDGLDKLKSVKLLYLIDRVVLLRTGRPILGDTYICMDYGPVPSKSYDHLKKIESGDDEGYTLGTEDSAGKYPVYRAKAPADLDIFAQSELVCIKEVLAQYGELSGLELSKLTHSHKAWTESDKNCAIDYCLFFADQPNANRDAFEAMLFEQEDRDFMDS